MKDRLLGYTVIGIILVFLLLPMAYLKWKSTVPMARWTIAFAGVKTLSFLSVQDPVSMQGVVIGEVMGVHTRNDTVYMKIETKEGMRLHENYSISVDAKGVMGDRSLSILPGDSHLPVIPPGTLLRGTVNMGLDDALSYMNRLQSAIHALATLSEELKNGTAQRRSLVEKVWQFTIDMDSIFRSVTGVIKDIDTSLKRGIDSAVIVLDTAIALVRRISDQAPSTITTVSGMLHSLENALTKLDTLVVKVDSVTIALEDPDIILWKKYSGSIRKNLLDLQKIIRNLQCDPLTLPVRVW